MRVRGFEGCQVVGFRALEREDEKQLVEWTSVGMCGEFSMGMSHVDEFIAETQFELFALAGLRQQLGTEHPQPGMTAQMWEWCQAQKLDFLKLFNREEEPVNEDRDRS